MPIPSGLDGEDRATINDLRSGMIQIKTELADIKELLTAERGEVIKEAYKVPEVAKKTKLTVYTVRQAYNKGRIAKAYKGRDHQWRIPHAALMEIEKNGLPPE